MVDSKEGLAMGEGEALVVVILIGGGLGGIRLCHGGFGGG
jgi:hypothetical protein